MGPRVTEEALFMVFMVVETLLRSYRWLTRWLLQ